MKTSLRTGMITAGMAVVLGGTLAQPAMAATYRYNNSVLTQSEPANSGTRPHIDGGYVIMEGGNFGIMGGSATSRIGTYVSGYETFAATNGDPYQKAVIEHQRVSNAQSSCFWTFRSQIDGGFNMKCAYDY